MSVNRREFIRRVVAASILVATGIVGVLELLERQDNTQTPANVITLQRSTTTEQSSSTLQATSSAQTSQSSTKSTSQSTSQSSTQAVPPGYILVAPVSALSGKSSAYFNHPSGGYHCSSTSMPNGRLSTRLALTRPAPYNSQTPRFTAHATQDISIQLTEM